MILTEDQYPGLPKWPAVFVTGKSVTPEQAKEIIFRTESSVQYPSEYSIGGNDRAFQKSCFAKFGWAPLIAAEQASYKLHTLEGEVFEAEAERICPKASGFEHIREVGEQWQERMGLIQTEYVYNSMLASSYIGGPTGWMSPSGNILVDGHNYGKWPDVINIVEDWQKLLDAFPYLDLVCTLFDREQCQANPIALCTIKVGAGEVVVMSPDLSLHDRNPTMGSGVDDFLSNVTAMMHGNHRYEQGWPAGWVEEFGAASTVVMKEIAPWLFDAEGPWLQLPEVQT